MLTPKAAIARLTASPAFVRTIYRHKRDKLMAALKATRAAQIKRIMARELAS